MFLEQELYQKIRESLPIVCVDLLVVSNGQYLLVKRSQPPAKGQWWFPGGRILKNETIEQACKRKAKEELGLIVNVGEIVSVEESIFDDEQPVTHTINIVTATYPDNKNQHIKLDKFHSEYQWKRFADSRLHPCVYRPLVKAGFQPIVEDRQ